MATVTSTRPPTSGEASSAASGEGGGELPIADVADWGHLLQETRLEAEGPVAAVPPADVGAMPEEQRSEEQAPAPPVEPPPLEAASPEAAVASIEVEDFTVTPPPVRAVTEPPGLEEESSWDELTPPRPPLLGMPHVQRVSFPPVESEVASVVVDSAQLTTLLSSAPLPGTNTPPPGTPLPVLLLVDQAQNASGEERQELSRRINRWLDKMVREGGSRHVADWFHRLIESGRLEGLADAAGHSCHETAVRGLLAMGFPYALEVRPEDLERLKPEEEQPRSRKRGRKLKGAAAGVLVGGAVAEVWVDILRRHVSQDLVTVEVGVMLLAMVALLVGKPRSPTRHMGLAVLVVAAVLSLSLGLLGGYGGLVAGLGGLVAALLFALHRS